MILRPRQAAIAVGAADDEDAGRIDVEFVVGGHPAFGQDGADDAADGLADVGLAGGLVVLGGNDDAGGADGDAVLVGERDLALGVGLEAGPALAAERAEFFEDAVGVVDRRRHQVGGFVGGVAEHDALVAGTLVLVAGRVDADRDVGGLGVQVALVGGGVAPGEAVLVVADLADGFADEGLEAVEDGVGAADLAGEDDAVGGDHGLAGDAGFGVGGEVGVENGVAQAVGHLVGMPIGDRLRCEQVAALLAHDLWNSL